MHIGTAERLFHVVSCSVASSSGDGIPSIDNVHIAGRRRRIIASVWFSVDW